MNVQVTFAQYDALFGDDPGTYLEFLTKLEASLWSAKRRLGDALLLGEGQVVSDVRHALKPTLQMLGASPLVDLLFSPVYPGAEADVKSQFDQAMDVVLAAVEAKKINSNESGRTTLGASAPTLFGEAWHDRGDAVRRPHRGVQGGRQVVLPVGRV